MKIKDNKYHVISLFAGCGGLDLGFLGGFTSLGRYYSRRKFNFIWANEINTGFCETYKKYFKHDIVEVDIKDVLSGDPIKQSCPLPPHSDIVLGGFPCQDFSHAGKRRGFGNENGRGLLYKSMVEVIKRVVSLFGIFV